MIAILRRFAWAASCLLGWGQLHAGCVIGVPHPTIHVGSASDPKCNYTSIQAAINSVSTSATCPPNIVIANKPGNAAWNEALTITDRSLALIGNADTCTVNTGGAVPDAPSATAATTPQAIISGAGLNAPVITINGNSNVTVQALEITGGNLTGKISEGGGIFFSGAGSLTLNATTIDHNQAEYGGGINMSPSGSATLTLQANTLVLNNTASGSGGGILLQGATRMFMLADGSSVSFNQAQSGYGGGIEIFGPARADIGSSGAFVVGAVSNNSAAYGGGIAILGGLGEAIARLFSTSATQPVLVSNNSASAFGGAFYLKPGTQNNVAQFATLCAYNYRIDNNSAPDGAAIYADYDVVDQAAIYGSRVYFNPGGNCGSESPASLGAVACAAGAPCNEVSNNAAVDGNGNPLGAIISMNAYAALAVEGLEMRGNHASQMIFPQNPYEDTLSYLHGCLIADNQSAQSPIQSDGDLTVANCTLANNTIGSGSVIFAVRNFTLTDTIIDQPGVLTMDYRKDLCGTCQLVASYLLSTDITTLPGGNDIRPIFPGDPLFVDSANGNYHLPAYRQNGLLTASPAIDFALTVAGDPAHDLDGNPYDQDVQAVTDLFGSRDLGAYEMQPINDRIFADAFGDAISLVY